MKNLSITIIIILLSINCKAQKVFTFNDPKSKFTWTGYASVGTYAPTGTLKMKMGNVELKEKSIGKAIFEFDMKSLTHENKDLESHLKNEDFFDVEKYPKAVFLLEKITDKEASGTLKIKDVKKKISFPITIKKTEKEIRILATININRTDFGIKYNSNSFFQNLGDYAIKDNFDFKIDLLMESK